MRLVVGVTGASGAIYAHRMLLFLREHRAHLDLHVDLVLSKPGRLVWLDELGVDPADLGFPIFGANDIAAPFASGSARYDAMVVVPCSAGTLARIATGVSTNLIGRAADVCLKERRPLVLVFRESPYSLVQVRNMATVLEAGARVVPASPSFYSKPATIEALVDTVTSRVLDQIGIDNDLMRRWSGLDRTHRGDS